MSKNWPIPQSNPAIGTGLALVGSYIYNPNDAPQTWTTGVAGLCDRFSNGGGGGKARIEARFRRIDRHGFAVTKKRRAIFVPISL
jgi:hypothetical protein